MRRFCGRALAALVLTCASGAAVSQTTTTYRYDVLGRLTEAAEIGGGKVVYGYDAAGNRVTLSNGTQAIELAVTAFSTSSNSGGFSGLGQPATMRDLSFQGQASAHITQAQAANWIQADLGAPTLIDHVDLAPPDRSLAGGGVAALNGATLEYSIDGSAWTAGPTIGGATPGYYTTVTISAQARYVRVRKSNAALGVGDFRLFSVPKSANHSPSAGLISRLKQTKNEPLSAGVASSVTDLDGDSATVTAVSSATSGVTSFTAGSIGYTPSANFLGEDSFTYTVADDHGGFATGTVRLKYNDPASSPINYDPVAVDDGGPNNRTFIPYAAGLDTPIINVLANDSDPDGNALSIIAAGPGQHGIVDFSNGVIRYYLRADQFTGFEDFPYTVSDGKGGTATARVWVRIGNTYPEATSDTIATAQNTGVNIWLLDNDHDADGDPLVIGSYTQPAHGSLTKVGDKLMVYTPAHDYVGPDSFTYTARDTFGANGAGNVYITVNPGSANSPPIARNDFSAASPAPIPFNTTVSMMVLANDYDPNEDPITISSFASPAHGTLARVTAYPEHLDYKPTAGYSGPDSFSYTISDGRGGTATATAYVLVGPDPAHVPQAVDDGPYQMLQDGEILLTNLLANDVEPDGEAMTITRLVGPSHGQATILNGSIIRYRPNAGYVGEERFYYVVADSHGGEGGASITINIAAPNRSPSAANDGPISAFSNTAATINVLANDSDPDGDGLTITSISQPAHGTAVIASGKITYTSAAGYIGADGLTYTVSDGRGGTASAAVSITVRSVANHAPIANGDYATAAFNTAGAISVLTNDQDPDTDTLTIASVTQPAHGSTVIAGRQVTYTPAAGYSGPDSFTYTASDGRGGVASATVNVTVLGNQPPTAVNDTVTTAFNTAKAVDVLANDSDPDGGVLTVASVTTPAHGAAAVVAGQVIYTPAAGYSGPDAFGYTVSDGWGGAASATVSVTVQIANRAPVAVGDTVTAAFNGSTTVDVLANDSDADGDILTVSSATAPAHGTAVIAGGRITYTPTTGYSGPDSFGYTVSDGHGGTGSATVSVTVRATQNRSPTAGSEGYTVPRDTFTILPVLNNDTDQDGDPLRIIAISAAAGQLEIVDGKAIAFTPTEDTPQVFQFTYTITDDQGGTASGLVELALTSNHWPIPVSDSFFIPSNKLSVLRVLANDSDPDGDALRIKDMRGPQHGVTWFQDGGFAYTPATDYVGPDTLRYSVTDDRGAEVWTDVTINVMPNHLPEAYADTLTLLENTSKSVAVLANDYDRDGDALTIVSVTAPAHGWAGIANGKVTYIPVSGYIGPDSFDYVISDGRGGTASATVSITVQDSNRAPVATADAVTIAFNTAKTIAVLANDSDADGDALTITAVTTPAHGTAVIAGGQITYTPTSGYSGADSFSYTIADPRGATASATVTLTVQANRPPVAVNDTAMAVSNGGRVIDVLTNDSDADGDTLTITSVTTPAHGTAVIAAGRITYTPTAGYLGPDSFGYAISDGRGGTASATVNITIENRAPLATSDTYILAKNETKTLTPRGNDTDPDGDPLVIVATTKPAHGVVSIVSGGSAVVYTPTTNYQGADSFLYNVSDGRGGLAVAQVSLTISGNRAPVPVDDVVRAPAGYYGQTTFDVLANDSDPDGDSLILFSVWGGGDEYGYSAYVSNGKVVFQVTSEDTYGLYSVPYSVTDDKGGMTTGWLRISVGQTVLPQSDALFALADTANTYSLTNDLLANDRNASGAPVTLSQFSRIMKRPNYGTITVNSVGNAFTYTPNPGFVGTDSFQYLLSDGVGGGGGAGVEVAITVAASGGGNRLPRPGPGYVEAAIGVPTPLPQLLTLATDPDGDPLTISVPAWQTPPTKIINGVLVYTSSTSAVGEQSFTYTLSDGRGGTVNAFARILLRGNTPPGAVGDSYAVQPGLATSLTVLANDNDPNGDDLTISAIASPPAHGKAQIIGGKTLSYTPRDGYAGSDSLVYTIVDGNGGSASATVTINVLAAANAPPAAVDDGPIAVSANTAKAINVLANDSNSDGGVLTIASVTTPAHGTAVIGGGVITYTPSSGYVGADSFTYAIADGRGGAASATVSVTVKAANTPPTVSGGSFYIHGAGWTRIYALNAASDADGDPLVIDSVWGATRGRLEVSGPYIIYIPNGYNPEGTDTINFKITDGQGGYAASTITVKFDPEISTYMWPLAVDDRFTVASDSCTVLQILTNDFNFTSTYTYGYGRSFPKHGGMSINDYGTAWYCPNAGYVGEDSFDYMVNDGAGGTSYATVYVTVGPATNHPPRPAPNIVGASGGRANTFAQLLNNDTDPDGDALTIVSAQGARNGTLTLGANNTVIFTPPAGFFGEDWFTYTVSDGKGGTAEAAVYVTINPNQPPTAAVDNRAVKKNQTTLIDVLANDADGNGDPLTIVEVSPPSQGTAVIQGNQIAYTPPANFIGSASFTYKVSDGFGLEASSTVGLMVIP